MINHLSFLFVKAIKLIGNLENDLFPILNFPV